MTPTLWFFLLFCAAMLVVAVHGMCWVRGEAMPRCSLVAHGAFTIGAACMAGVMSAAADRLAAMLFAIACLGGIAATARVVRRIRGAAAIAH